MIVAPGYVVDASALIQAARQFYAFDIFPAFWSMLEMQGAAGQIGSIDRVLEELELGRDRLAEWATNNSGIRFASTDRVEVLERYRRIMGWLQKQDQFFEAGKMEFAAGADGWLVAYAAEEQCKVVTQEKFNAESKRTVPIPNVCMAFGVQCVDLFAMMRELHITF